MLARENFLPSRPAVAAKIALPGNETSSLGRSSLIVAILCFLDRLFCISLNDGIFYLFLSGVTYPWYVEAHPVRQEWPGPCL